MEHVTVYFFSKHLSFVQMKRKKQRRDEILLAMIIQRIKDLRNNHSHSQEYLAENIGIDIPHLETGDNFPNITTLAIFCEFYNITLDEFFAPLNYPIKK